MKLQESIFWIGSGEMGMQHSDRLDCNVYLLDGGVEKAIIDCGSGFGVDNMLERCSGIGIEPWQITHVLLTHAHMDHAGGAFRFKNQTEASLTCSEKSARLLADGDEEKIGLVEGRKAGIYPPDCRLHPIRTEHVVKHGDLIQIGHYQIRVIDTPGHSADSISYFIEETGALFSGDVVFWGGQIAHLFTDDFSMSELEISIQRLSKLKVNSLFPGHLLPVLKEGYIPIHEASDRFRNGCIPSSIV